MFPCTLFIADCLQFTGNAFSPFGIFSGYDWRPITEITVYTWHGGDQSQDRDRRRHHSSSIAGRPWLKDITLHVVNGFHSGNLTPRDRSELELPVILYLYADAFSRDDALLLRRRLQLFAVVVTAGWQTASKISKREQLRICGVDIQAGDITAPKSYYKKRQANRKKKAP